ncbi:MAG: sigma 54-interacting transcriptional regulator, partial [Planctomycetes bacterium]|nr:sigma 54-interacting transcriptional regulator [Planctomycetota bacterium]
MGRKGERYATSRLSTKVHVLQERRLIGVSALFKSAIAAADAIATNDCITLIEGESGTGKELLARYIHSRSARRDGPFIPINCAGITEALFESQFFGHVRGSFTGAVRDTLGVVR